MPDIIDDFEFEICLRGSVEKLRMGGGRPERCVWGVKAEKIDDLTTNFKITSTPEGVFINALGEKEHSLREWMSEPIPTGCVRVVWGFGSERRWQFWRLESLTSA